MADLEKTIKGLECCSLEPERLKDCRYRGCPYSDLEGKGEFENFDCVAALSRDALSLLKAQEARLLTLDEARTLIGTPRWVEYYITVNDSEPILQASWAIVQAFNDKEYDDEYFVSFSTAYGVMHWHIAAYGSGWRMWDKEPTDEQRKAVKWDG